MYVLDNDETPREVIGDTKLLLIISNLSQRPITTSSRSMITI
jgi:hypothetical protein